MKNLKFNHSFKKFFKKNILSKIFSKFIALFNVPRTHKLLNQFTKKTLKIIFLKFQLNLLYLPCRFFYIFFTSRYGIIMNENIQNELEEKLKEYNLDLH